MTWIEDLSPLPYVQTNGPPVRAIGWLASGKPFPTGASLPAFVDKLTTLIASPFQPFVTPGVHTCDLCQFDGPGGSRMVWVPSASGVFVAPELVGRFLQAHWYHPPDEFCRAVMDCPPPVSMQYKRQFLASGGRGVRDSYRKCSPCLCSGRGPIRDLGHVYAEITVRPAAGSRKSWTGRALVDTGATDTFLPSSVLRKLGVKPVGRRSYEMADGTEHSLPFGVGAVELLGEITGGTLVFAGDEQEPLLGVTVLESAGFWIDPRRERLIRRPPKRKTRPLA